MFALKQYYMYFKLYYQNVMVCPCVVGAGKSALVANWVGRVEENQPEAFIFVHFIGSSAKSVSHTRIIRR